MNYVIPEGANAYLSSAKRRLAEAAALLAEAGVKYDDPSLTLILAADMAITELQDDVAPTSSTRL